MGTGMDLTAEEVTRALNVLGRVPNATDSLSPAEQNRLRREFGMPENARRRLDVGDVVREIEQRGNDNG